MGAGKPRRGPAKFSKSAKSTEATFGRSRKTRNASAKTRWSKFWRKPRTWFARKPHAWTTPERARRTEFSPPRKFWDPRQRRFPRTQTAYAGPEPTLIRNLTFEVFGFFQRNFCSFLWVVN